MKKKLCIVTSTRADYSFFKPLINLIKKNQNLELQLIVTGTHLEEKYGNTIKDIQKDDVEISATVKVSHENSSEIGVIKTMSDTMKEVGIALNKLKPNMVVLLGDRYEIFSVAAACVILGIPIAHASGGDVTYGAYDDMFRHSITKMSYLHFTSCEEYRKRVIQLGENPDRVFAVGSLSIENLKSIDFLSKDSLEQEFGFDITKTLLATFHPVTMEENSGVGQFLELMEAAVSQNKYNFLFTKPNADNNSDNLVKILDDFQNRYPDKIRTTNSLGTLKYMSMMKHCAGVIGNSSSGILEAPSFKKGTINIGNRQKGRICATSVINCEAKKEKIIEAIKILESKEFQDKLGLVKNPYEQDNTSQKIIAKIEEFLYKEMNPKQFFDLNFHENI